AYLKHATAMRAAANAEAAEAEEPAQPEEDEEIAEGQVNLSLERLAELGAAEELVLTVSSEGFGKRTSAYDYRRSGRLVASFPVEESDEILLVSDQGQLIRVPVDQIRIAGRNTQGVTIFRKAE